MQDHKVGSEDARFRFSCSAFRLRLQPVDATHWRNRDAVHTAVLASTEIYGVGAIRIRLCGYVVVAIHAEVVGFQVAIGIVDGDRPERVNRYILYVVVLVHSDNGLIRHERNCQLQGLIATC
jgi:hypothetical protein